MNYGMKLFRVAKPTLEKQQSRRNDFEYIKEIGEGSFGTVNMVSRKSDNKVSKFIQNSNHQIFALKILDK